MSQSTPCTEAPNLNARVGTIVGGRWRIDHLIGVGGMAAVYSATHRNGHAVAIKIIHSGVRLDPDLCTRFMREGYIGNQIAHPAVIQTLDDGVTDDGAQFLVMDLLHGATLAERLQTGPLPLQEIVDIADTVLAALHEAHAHGILHRDLKPENIFLTTSGETKLLDFGIARERDTTTRGATLIGMAMGTPSYMPPEQARGRWDLVDARSDLWAVAAVIFTSLSGTPLRSDGTPVEQLAQALGPLPPVQTLCGRIPKSVAVLLDRAFSYEPRDRFSSAAEMREALKVAVRQSPEDGSSTEFALPVRNVRPRSAVVAAALGVSMILGFALRSREPAIVVPLPPLPAAVTDRTAMETAPTPFTSANDDAKVVDRAERAPARPSASAHIAPSARVDRPTFPAQQDALNSRF